MALTDELPSMTLRPDCGVVVMMPGRSPSMTWTSTLEMTTSSKPAKMLATALHVPGEDGVVAHSECMISIV